MKTTKLSLLLILALCFSVISVFAEGPIGPENVDVTSERFDSTNWPAYQTEALAGNISSMNIHSWTLTRTWAGYYGNITGTIVLADTNNNTMYDWEDLDPSGRVYASRDPLVQWANISCASSSELSVGEAQFSGTNETDRNGKYPMDSPNRTFVPLGGIGAGYAQPATFPDFPLIYVGPVDIDPSTCLSTSLHNENGTYIDYNQTNQNQGNNPERFRELVLSDNDADSDGLSIVYTTIIEKNYLGFDNRTHDFEIIIPEDGHGTNTATTTYYFYVELV